MRKFLLAIPVVALLLSGCSSVRTESNPSIDVLSLGTYAWVDRPPIKPIGTEVRDAALTMRIRKEVDARLAAVGMRKVPAGEARVLLSANVGVETKVQQNDPYYSLHVVERYELGTLTLDAFDARSDELARHGEVWHRLRYVARSMGGIRPRFVATSQQPDWPIEDMVAKIFEALR